METLKETATGRLYGVICDKTLIVVSFSIDLEDEDKPALTAISCNDLQLSMPVEVDFCGVLLVGDVTGNIPDAFKVSMSIFAISLPVNSISKLVII